MEVADAVPAVRSKYRFYKLRKDLYEMTIWRRTWNPKIGSLLENLDLSVVEESSDHI